MRASLGVGGYAAAARFSPEKFDCFIECYNNERPHQAIEMHDPREPYRSSEGAYHGIDALEYPCHDRTVAVTMVGRVCFGSRKAKVLPMSSA